MMTPEWLNLGAYGAVIGAITVMVVGFSWGGWMTGGGANEMAADRAHDEVIAALVPICLPISHDDLERTARMATITEATTYRRRDAVMETGWATITGTEAPNRDLAQASIEVLDLKAAKFLQVSVTGPRVLVDPQAWDAKHRQPKLARTGRAALGRASQSEGQWT